MSDCYVYIIAKELGCGSDQQWSGPVKVGLSISPGGRLDSIQTAAPFKIGIYQLARLPNRETALEIEQAFHRMMSEHRLHGEWFNLTPEAAREQLAIGVAAYAKICLGCGWDQMKAVVNRVFAGKVVLTQ